MSDSKTRPGSISAMEKKLQIETLALHYPYEVIAMACNNFSNEMRLGEGSYGEVFRGCLVDGTEIAVKRLNEPKEAGFIEEVRVLSKFRHPNLVILLGYAKKGKQRLLVYEYLAGGDFSACIEDCNWRMRISILLDSALGLAHLTSASPKVYHRDIKTPNIMVDSNGCAKISDFGLAMLANCSKLTVKQVIGTLGYADPEYVRTSVVSEASEMYSFAMVILETLTGVPPALILEDGSVDYTFAKVHTVDDVMDMLDPTCEWPDTVAEELAALGLWALQERPEFVRMLRRLRTLYRKSDPRPSRPKVNFRPQVLRTLQISKHMLNSGALVSGHSNHSPLMASPQDHQKDRHGKKFIDDSIVLPGQGYKSVSR